MASQPPFHPTPSQSPNSASTLTPGLEQLPKPKNKRARPTISCLECRRKKLKCDRVLPCAQCVKSGREGSCAYADGAGPSGDGKRVRVEEGVAGRRNVNDVEISRDPLKERERAAMNEINSGLPGKGEERSLGKIWVKGDRSKFLGPGDKMALLDHFKDAKTFIVNGFKEPDMANVMNELSMSHKILHTQRSPKETPAPVCPSLGRSGLIVSMVASMPSPFTAGMVKAIYSSYWENLIRVLHRPTFERDFNTAARATQNGGTVPKELEFVIPQFLATLALTGPLAGRGVLDKVEFSEEKISKWADLVQRYVDDLKGKELLNLQNLRVQILLLLMHQNKIAPPSALWKESGNLSRTAMTMGLHHDPEDCGDLSVFQREQRRKIWRTIVELDIQCSLAAGMPSAIQAPDFSSKSLRNLSDDDLKEDMLEFPPDKQPHEWTDSIAQIALGASIKERLAIVNILGGKINLEPDAPLLLQRAKLLESHLYSLPAPLRSDTVAGRSNDKVPGRLFAKIMLDVYLRRALLSIYRTIAISRFSARYPEARRAAVQSSIAILSHLDALDPAVADPNIIKDRDMLNHFHVLCKNDIIQAALMLCIEIRRFSFDTMDEVQDFREELPWTKHSLTRIVENTLNSFIQRLGEFGSDLKDIVPLSIVLQSVRSDGTPEEKRQSMRNGAERILKACRAILPDIQGRMPQGQNTDGNGTTETHEANNSSEANAGNGLSTEPPVFFRFSGPAKIQNPNLVYPQPQFINQSWVDMNMGGIDLDFQDVDFGFADWGMDQAWL